MSTTPKKQACEFFGVNSNQAKPFDIQNPFFSCENKPPKTLQGFINRKDGLMGGSLFITHVHGTKLTHPQKVYGVPKLLYPYVEKKEKEEPGTKAYKDHFSTPDTIMAYALTNK